MSCSTGADVRKRIPANEKFFVAAFHAPSLMSGLLAALPPFPRRRAVVPSRQACREVPQRIFIQPCRFALPRCGRSPRAISNVRAACRAAASPPPTCRGSEQACRESAPTDHSSMSHRPNVKRVIDGRKQLSRAHLRERRVALRRCHMGR